MTTSSPPVCPRCGSPLPARALGGACAACLARAALMDPPPPEGILDEDAEEILDSFGDYALLSQIARGGMGIVFRARQRSLNRTVALKMILDGQFAGAEQVRRFRAEAEGAARLDHPNIVPIYEVGAHDDRPWFSMRFIEGPSLSARLASAPDGRLPAREAATLVAKIARAIHYAHQRGLLHRDLKPANILLDEHGEPHVTDFGLARETEGQGLTLTGSVLGTPGYMAPEQAAGKVNELTTAVDIFALGAVLYHALTGRPPFQGGNAAETLTLAAQCEPARPSTLGVRLDADLETICLHCLEKEPALRFGSAAAFADDLERWLRGETILSRRSTAARRALKWARRRPAIAALSGIALLLLVLGVCGVVWQWRRAESALIDSRESLRTANFERARAVRVTRRPGQRTEALAAIREAVAIRPSAELRDDAIAALALYDLQDDGLATELSPDVRNVSVDKQLSCYACLDGARTITVRRFATGEVILRIPDCGLAEPDMLLSSQSGVFIARTQSSLRVWRLTGPEPVFAAGAVAGEPRLLDNRLTADEQRIFMADERGRLRSVELSALTLSALSENLTNTLSFLMPHPAEPVVALAGKEGLTLVNTAGGAAATLPRRPDAYTGPLAWNSAGTLLAIGYDDGIVAVHDLRVSRRSVELAGHTRSAVRIQFHPQWPLLVSFSWDNTVRLWDAFTGDELLKLGGWRLLGFSADGSRLAVWKKGSLQFLRLVPPAVCRVLGTLAGRSDGIHNLDFNASQTLLAGQASNNLFLWDLRDGTSLARPHTARGLGFWKDDVLIVSGHQGLQRWETKLSPPGGPVDLKPAVHVLPDTIGKLGGMNLRRSDDEMIVQFDSGNPFLVDLQSGSIIREYEGRSGPSDPVLSADGRWIAAGFWSPHPGYQSFAAVWDRRTGELIARMPDGNCRVFFSPDSRFLVVASASRCRLFETGSWREMREFPVDESTIEAGHAAFSPDSFLLALRATDRIARLVNPHTGSEIARLTSQDQRILKAMKFSPDGRFLAIGTEANVQLWDLSLLKKELAALGFPQAESRAVSAE